MLIKALSLTVFAPVSIVTDRQTDGRTDILTIAKVGMMLLADALASVAKNVPQTYGDWSPPGTVPPPIGYLNNALGLYDNILRC